MATILKPRNPSLELLIMNYLSKRMTFTKEQEKQLFAINSGYEGEVIFDKNYETCPDNWIVLNDLWLKADNSSFQIDSLLITIGTMFLFDVKNFTGEYELKNGKFYKNGIETKHNPLTQLDRCLKSLCYLLKMLNNNTPAVSKLMFVNPSLTLFGLTPDAPIAVSSQLNSFFNRLKNTELHSGRRSINPSQQQFHIANQILSLHLNEPPFSNIPKYTLDSLEKGIVCENCGGFLPPPGYKIKILTCHTCGSVESVEDSILRSIKEFKILFPHEVINSDKIQQWCKIISCNRRISRVLNKYYERMGSTNSTHYVDRIVTKVNM